VLGYHNRRGLSMTPTLGALRALTRGMGQIRVAAPLEGIMEDQAPSAVMCG
jgi:hypothetical protein